MFTTDIAKYPTDAGVYLFKDKKDTILYIGKAKNLQKRIGQYFAHNSLRKQEMLSKATKVDFLIVKNESEALYLEDNLIKQHQPFYNNLLKADNSYTYIKITREQFPQIILTKRRINDGSIYIGPKKDSIQLKKFLQYLRQILKFRGCKTTQFKQGKLCSDYYFGLCRGRCKLAKNNLSSFAKGGVPTGTEDLKRNEGGFGSDYKNIIANVVSFFKGNTKPIEREIHEQIEVAIIHENYERAAQLRDIYQSLQGFVEKQDVVLPDKKDGYLAMIKPVGNQRIYTVLIFIQGKLIDVITSKESHSDVDEDSLCLAIQREFGEGKTTKLKNETHITSQPQKLRASLIKKRGVPASRDGGFEWKPKQLKPLLSLAENFLESYIITQSLQEESTLINDMFATLQKRYNLKHIPYRIECIDISHLSGGRTSGGLSCLMAGLPYKKGYRKYKISGKQKAGSLKPSDDYAALEEVLERRFKQNIESSEIISGNPLPSCLIIDGGKGQLNVVKKLCKDPKRKEIVSQIDIISLGKGEARTKSNIGKTTKTKELRAPLILAPSLAGKGETKRDLVKLNSKITEIIYTLTPNLKIHQTPMTYDQADKIFLKARDEAHRFANSYRKKQMSQEFKK